MMRKNARAASIMWYYLVNENCPSRAHTLKSSISEEFLGKCNYYYTN
jgi:hypothetical protein